jgi:hypothetical protein
MRRFAAERDPSIDHTKGQYGLRNVATLGCEFASMQVQA